MEGKEKRLQPRVEIKWSVTVLTSEEAMQGETKQPKPSQNRLEFPCHYNLPTAAIPSVAGENNHLTAV